jgi:hypothetical protein
MEIILLFIWGWQSLNSNSGFPTTPSIPEVKNECNYNVIPTGLRGLYMDNFPLALLCVLRTVSVNYVEVQVLAFNVTHFESRTTRLFHTARNTTEHG